MNERTSKKPGIADYVAAHRKHKDCFLDEIDRLIDWKPLEKVLRNKLKRVANAVGNPAYPPLLMFKILLLQRWYSLSDMAVEEALCDRLSFVRLRASPWTTTRCRTPPRSAVSVRIWWSALSSSDCWTNSAISWNAGDCSSAKGLLSMPASFPPHVAPSRFSTCCPRIARKMPLASRK